MSDPYDPFDSDFAADRDPGPWHGYLVAGTVGGLVGAAAVLLVWVMVSALAPDSRVGAQASRPRGAATVMGPQHASTGPQSCAARFAAQRRTLRTAEATLAQWKVHVDAMNQLVSGRITLRQATAFWNRTRVGARQRLARYDAAARALDDTPDGCSAGAATTADDSECAAAVAARDRALRKAHRSVATWRGHVHDMEMLREGTLSPDMAEQMWMQSWHRGVRQLDAYRSAAQAAQGQRC